VTPFEQDNLVSVLVPLINEVESLNETISTIEHDSPDRALEFILILSPSSTKEAIKNAERQCSRRQGKARIIVQNLKGLGGAYIDGIREAKGRHIVMIASDLETDPKLVQELLKISELNPNHIVATTRWKGDSAGFQGYGATKKILNFIFQKLISKMFSSKLTDYTFGFRLYPSESIKNRQWKSTNFAFLLESILVPIKDGWEVVEVPHFWRPRVEGKSSNKIRYFVDYFAVALRVKLNK
jgi:glycosyltransferase involved in cell wall biosynthesis